MRDRRVNIVTGLFQDNNCKITLEDMRTGLEHQDASWSFSVADSADTIESS